MIRVEVSLHTLLEEAKEIEREAKSSFELAFGEGAICVLRWLVEGGSRPSEIIHIYVPGPLSSALWKG